LIVIHTLSITEDLMRLLGDAIFAKAGHEGAAYLCCGLSSTAGETRLLARAVVPVSPDHYLVREADRLSIASDSYVPIAKRAKLEHEAILFVHSHPEDCPDFSRQDDAEDEKLIGFFSSRAPQLPHGSMVFNARNQFQARIRANEAWSQVSRVRIVGNHFRFVDRVPDESPIPDFFDRQVRAFGPDIQRLLRRLHVGVVGAGGTGSATIEQLTRLGIGKISVFDGDRLDRSNVTRVYGSAVSDHGKPKTEIQQSHVHHIGLRTDIITYATEQDYDNLHRAMKIKGFSRLIPGGDGKNYHLPHAEYNRDADLTIEQVRTAAATAAASMHNDFQILVTKGTRAWQGLKQATPDEIREAANLRPR
jgi:ThiF family/Prokaryotic homologs of the JAB domain